MISLRRGLSIFNALGWQREKNKNMTVNSFVFLYMGYIVCFLKHLHLIFILYLFRINYLLIFNLFILWEVSLFPISSIILLCNNSLKSNSINYVECSLWLLWNKLNFLYYYYKWIYYSDHELSILFLFKISAVNQTKYLADTSLLFLYNSTFQLATSIHYIVKVFARLFNL